MRKIVFLILCLSLFHVKLAQADIAADDARAVFTGDAKTVAFATTFKILAAGDVAVYVDGTLKQITTDYTLSNVGNDAGATVTFVSAPADQAQVLLLRNQAISQTTTYATGSVSAAVIEADFDKQTSVDQMQQEEINRSLRLPKTQSSALAGTTVTVENGGIVFTFTEVTSAPAAPSADGAKLYAIDNGAGKTQLCAIFSSGAAQCFATQP